ncbi:MAG: hypothetical protein FH749_04335 [Firmicutes bacterium]|nr:hypothetical protein [Bacillota bacterium]
MSDNRRNQLLSFVERELIGPDPIDWEGLTQDNGEEVLMTDPPRTRYIAGVLFPHKTTDSDAETREEEGIEAGGDDREDPGEPDSWTKGSGDGTEYLEDAEELINRSNAYRQSAISLTAALKKNDTIHIEVSAGVYTTLKLADKVTGNDIVRYPRRAIFWNNEGKPIDLPSPQDGIVKIPSGTRGLQFDMTYRYNRGDYSIYTFTLENTNRNDGNAVKDDDCFFQVKFKLYSELGFCPLPNSQRINTQDNDYDSNQLLYRNVHNYAIGHGCAADWDESAEKVSWISSAVFPSYEIKPIVPSTIPGVTLDMRGMSPHGDFEDTVRELELMCTEYGKWINRLEIEKSKLEGRYVRTAERHIENCKSCLNRMRSGVKLLEENKLIRTAFQHMNLAMLMQQLHYNLPLQKWEDDGVRDIRLVDPIKTLPSVTDKNTWYGEKDKYGKWRPFQLAFILMNLHSMYDRSCDEREIVDLIWFPTGGGKTEAYLGLSAYAIFIRRLMDKNDSGTAILMRYTLRLLTAQQYERAAAMICACDLIRRDHEDLYGKARISIGLWVGGTTTPNKMDDAVKKYNKMKNSGGSNPFVVLKCPWCGAQMGVVERKHGIYETPGYRKARGQQGKYRIIFQCRNTENACDFSTGSYALPMYVIDDSIYESTPTLLLGTVDKFAMLPFRPQAQGLFGYKDGIKVTSPDLIIQDELHLIAGPLGSMVGHYETLISELCTTRANGREIRPKVIASTATISRAKEQCHSLYGCGTSKVFQFPPSGLDAGNSFFAKEDRKQNGRQYVGILATGSPSDTTTAIRLFSALLYGAKAMDVGDETHRDPYWTNVGYFNSIRELGQAATWIRADIDQHLDVMYKRRYYNKRYSKEEYNKRRRYIYCDEELTSRIAGDKVTASLANLNTRYPAELDENGKVREHPIDICLATNMISVGLDVPRLGLMTVAGQPKTTSEYIQATSRVGRNPAKAPGIVFVLYRPGRPRDKSHYEHFKGYHSRVYCNVEPTSVTPFSAPVRERALHAIMIGMMRLKGDAAFNADPPHLPDEALYNHIRQVIENRIEAIDPDELEATLTQMEHIIQRWEDWNPQKWEPERNRDWSYGNVVPLMYFAGGHRNEAWGQRGMETPSSMRSVDASCEADVLANRYTTKED